MTTGEALAQVERTRKKIAELAELEPGVDWRRLVARAATLDERLHASFEGTSRREEPDRSLPRRDLKPWMKACAGGDREAFERRLAWDGWTRDQLEISLAEDSLGNQVGAHQPIPIRDEAPSELPVSELPISEPSVTEPTPRWIASLSAAFARRQEVAEELAGDRRIAEESHFEAGRALPFLEILVPFLRQARSQLEVRSATEPETLACLAPAALRALEIRLLHDLVSLAVDSLYERFQLFRQAFLRGHDPSRSSSSGPPSRDLYLAFAEGFLRKGWAEFFENHGTLARQLGRVMDTWVETTMELGSRLRDDGVELVRLFGKGAEASLSFPRVEAIGAGLSDRHDSGRQVLSLRLEGGIRVVYKPRSMVLEGAYNALLQELQQAGLDPAPRSLKVLVRDGYGWVETADPMPLASREEARAYYRRAGALICLAYALRADDLHSGNVVAAAQGPVVVDGETFFQPSRQKEHGDPWDRSALRSQLLTNPQRGADGGAFDHGGLQAASGFMTESGRAFWKHTNTDSMSFEMRDVTADRGANEAWLPNEILARPEDYPEEILDGFERTYRFLIRYRPQLLPSKGALEPFCGGSTRILFRPSQIYGVLLARLAKPRYQQQALPGDFLIDSLNRAFLGSLHRPVLWPLAAQERQDLQGRDVPHFSLPTTSVDIPCRRGSGGETREQVVVGEFLRSGYEAVRIHLEALCEEDLEKQVGSIRRVLARTSSPFQGANPGKGSSSGRKGESLVGGGLPTARELVAQALAVGEKFLEAARLEMGSGEGVEKQAAIGWLQRADRRDRPLSLNLYGGALGTTLFLAALTQATGREDFRELARRGGEQLLRGLPGPPQSWKKEEGRAPTETWGLLSGLGGWLYALPRIGDFLGELEPWQARAESLAGSLRPEDFEPAMDFDLSDGIAGALVGLLELWQRTGKARYLDLVRACGSRLKETQQPAAGGPGAAWADSRGRLNAGLAHGAAGITLALARLLVATEGEAEQESLRRTIQGALSYERNLFSRRLGNWPVVGARRNDGRPLFMVAWCNGAAGIGLARLEISKLLRDPESRVEAQTALSTVSQAVPAATDHLCCGNLGRLELLLQAGLDGEGEGLHRAALLSLGQGLERVAAEGSFRLDGGSGSLYHPGFFRGLAGIGYSLLRFSDPQTYPSVLSFSSSPAPRP